MAAAADIPVDLPRDVQERLETSKRVLDKLSPDEREELTKDRKEAFIRTVQHGLTVPSLSPEFAYHEYQRGAQEVRRWKKDGPESYLGPAATDAVRREAQRRNAQRSRPNARKVPDDIVNETVKSIQSARTLEDHELTAAVQLKLQQKKFLISDKQLRAQLRRLGHIKKKGS